MLQDIMKFFNFLNLEPNIQINIVLVSFRHKIIQVIRNVFLFSINKSMKFS